MSLHLQKPGTLHIFVDEHKDLTLCGFRTMGRRVFPNSYKGDCKMCLWAKEVLDGLAE